jgi:hypothetical protein
MVNASRNPENTGIVTLMGSRAPSLARLVNHGQDTQISLPDGSTIVLKGVREVAAVLVAADSNPEPPPIGGEIGEDGQHAHRRRDDCESL